MCGIAGMVSAHARPADELDLVGSNMIRALAHRGPDSNGTWCDPETGVVVAHCRLSIVDLSAAGAQPMLSHDGRYVFSFNGEIYNHHAIRRKLESLGVAFRGNSDTEVLLAAVGHWGVKSALQRAVGMFAFSLWDRADRRLTLGRDRLGEKPLYYGWCGRDFCFSSEVKALRILPNWNATVNPSALVQYMQRGYVPGEQSIYSGISRLKPGTILSMSWEDLSNRRMAEAESYWRYRECIIDAGNSPINHGGENAILDQFEQLLEDSIRGQMLADVPVGAFLSGGIDSSLVVATMQKHSAQPVRTFTIGFNERQYDEAIYAREVAKYLGTEHTEFYVTAADAMSVIPKLPQIYDEPFADASQIPTYLVSELARRHVTVTLSGDGGDELFGGYTRYQDVRRLWEVLRHFPRDIRTLARTVILGVDPAHWDRLIRLSPRLARSHAFSGRPGDRMHKIARVIAAGSPYELYDQFSSIPIGGVLSGGEQPPQLLPNCEPLLTKDFCAWMLAYDAVNYLPDDILVKLDRASMAHGLEGRIPLLDHRLVEFSMKIPSDLRLGAHEGKRLLRLALKRHLPAELFERPKMGFSVPIGTWLRGPLAAWAEDLLSESRLRRDGLLSVSEVRRKWDEHRTGKRDWQFALWNILMFQAWLAHR